MHGLQKTYITSLKELTSRPHLSKGVANLDSRLKHTENNSFPLKNTLSLYCLSWSSFLNRRNRKLRTIPSMMLSRGSLVTFLVLLQNVIKDEAFSTASLKQ